MPGDLTWSILFDWAADGAFATNEAARVVALSIDRGRDDEFSEMKVGKAIITLDNYDGRFDPWNTGSPISPNILPGRAVRISVTYSGTVYPLLYGRIEDIEPSGRLGQKMVTVTVYDRWRDLIQNEAIVTLRTDVTTDVAIDAVLDAIGWSALYRDLDVGNDTLAYWWTSDTSAAKAIIDLVNSEHGLFYISHDGKATFRNRANTTTAIAAGTLDQESIGDILINTPWASVWNYVKVTANPITVASSAVIWALTDTAVEVLPGQTIDMWSPYADANGDACAAQDVITPAATTDYTASTWSAGGPDMTASMAVAATKYSTTAYLTVTNTHATATLYITYLQVRGKALTTTPTAIIRESTSSQAIYGKRKLTVDVPWQQSVNVAIDLAEVLRSFYDAPHKNVTCTLAAVYPDVFKYDLCDRIVLTAAVYDIGETMLLGSLRLASNGSMQDIGAIFHLEPADNTLYWLLGTAGNSELGTTTRLAY